MGILVRMGLLAGAGAVLYKMFGKNTSDDGVTGQPVHSSGVTRNAGPEEMRNPDARQTWDMVDEQADESFPASDPPGNY